MKSKNTKSDQTTNVQAPTTQLSQKIAKKVEKEKGPQENPKLGSLNSFGYLRRYLLRMNQRIGNLTYQNRVSEILKLNIWKLLISGNQKIYVVLFQYYC